MNPEIIEFNAIEASRLKEYLDKHPNEGFVIKYSLGIGMGCYLEIEDENGKITDITDYNSF